MQYKKWHALNNKSAMLYKIKMPWFTKHVNIYPHTSTSTGTSKKRSVRIACKYIECVQKVWVVKQLSCIQSQKGSWAAVMYTSTKKSWAAWETTAILLFPSCRTKMFSKVVIAKKIQKTQKFDKKMPCSS